MRFMYLQLKIIWKQSNRYVNFESCIKMIEISNWTQSRMSGCTKYNQCTQCTECTDCIESSVAFHPFDTQMRMIAAAEPGDHIAVQLESGWHHGIYAGKMRASSSVPYDEFCVIDTLKDTDHLVTSVRTVDDFAKGAKGYAIIFYVGWVRKVVRSKDVSLKIATSFCKKKRKVADTNEYYAEHLVCFCRRHFPILESISKLHKHISRALEDIHSIPV